MQLKLIRLCISPMCCQGVGHHRYDNITPNIGGFLYQRGAWQRRIFQPPSPTFSTDQKEVVWFQELLRSYRGQGPAHTIDGEAYIKRLIKVGRDAASVGVNLWLHWCRLRGIQQCGAFVTYQRNLSPLFLFLLLPHILLSPVLFLSCKSAAASLVSTMI